jgi:hypothetical protein
MRSHMAVDLIVSALLVWALGGGASWAAQNVSTAQDFVRTMQQGSLDQRELAIQTLRRIPLQQRDHAILEALTQELDRLAQMVRAREAALASGQSLTNEEGIGEYLGEVIEAVAQYKDPSIIRPLLPFVGTGSIVANAIADFGNEGVADLAASISNNAGDDSNVMGALLILRRIVERQALHPITAAAKQRVVAITRQRLSGIQNPDVLASAAELAVATGDEGLIRNVRQLIDDPAEIRRHGISDAKQTTFIRSKVAAALEARGQR